MLAKSNGFGPEALILLDFLPFLGLFFESEFLLVGNPQEVKVLEACTLQKIYAKRLQGFKIWKNHLTTYKQWLHYLLLKMVRLKKNLV